jgi:hypothetical protein
VDEFDKVEWYEIQDIGGWLAQSKDAKTFKKRVLRLENGEKVVIPWFNEKVMIPWFKEVSEEDD